MAANLRRLWSERERESERASERVSASEREKWVGLMHQWMACIIVVATVSGLLVLFSLSLVVCASFGVRWV